MAASSWTDWHHISRRFVPSSRFPPLHKSLPRHIYRFQCGIRQTYVEGIACRVIDACQLYLCIGCRALRWEAGSCFSLKNKNKKKFMRMRRKGLHCITQLSSPRVRVCPCVAGEWFDLPAPSGGRIACWVFSSPHLAHLYIPSAWIFFFFLSSGEKVFARLCKVLLNVLDAFWQLAISLTAPSWFLQVVFLLNPHLFYSRFIFFFFNMKKAFFILSHFLVWWRVH